MILDLSRSGRTGLTRFPGGGLIGRLALCLYPTAAFVAGALASSLDVLAAIATAGGRTTECSSASRLAGGIALMIGVEVARDILVGEVEEKCGIQGVSAKAGLKVEVRTRGTSRVATQADRLTSLDIFVGADELLRHCLLYTSDAADEL